MKILLNGNLIRYRTARVLGLLVLAYIVAIVADLYSSKSQLELSKLVPVKEVIILALCSILLLRKMSKVVPSITVDDVSLTLPLFYFWASTIPLASIVSLGEFGVRVGPPSFSISFLNGASRHLDSSVFSSPDEYEMLRKKLEEVVAQNRRLNSWSVLEIEQPSVGMHALQLIFVGIWGYLYYTAHLLNSGNENVFLELGALSQMVWARGEFYRLSSWFFLHSGIFHLLINILTFASLSTLLMRVMDASRYLCLLLLSTFIASIYVLTVTPDVQVIGASAGVFGLFGAHCALKFNRYLPVSIGAYSNRFIVFLVFVEFVGELFASGISSAAHLGGGLAGYALMRGILHCNPSNRIYESTLAEKGLAVFLSFAYAAGLLRFLWLAAHA